MAANGRGLFVRLCMVLNKYGFNRGCCFLGWFPSPRAVTAHLGMCARLIFLICFHSAPGILGTVVRPASLRQGAGAEPRPESDTSGTAPMRWVLPRAPSAPHEGEVRTPVRVGPVMVGAAGLPQSHPVL